MNNAAGQDTNNITGYKKKTYKLQRIMATLFLVSIFFFILAYWQAAYYERAKEGALEEAKTILTIKRIDRLIYSDIINDIVDSDIGVSTSHDFKNNKLVAANPATFHFESCTQVNEKLTNFLGCTIFSNHSWPTKTYKQNLDISFQERALENLKSSLDPYYEFITLRDGGEAVIYAEPMIMNQSCVDCHNTHPMSPVNDPINPIDPFVPGQPRGLEAVSVGLNIKRDYSFDSIFIGLCLIILSLGLYLYLLKNKYQNNYDSLSLDEYGIQNILNRKTFDDIWDSMCRAKDYKKSNNVLAISLYIKNFDDLYSYGEDYIAEIFKQVAIVAENNGIKLGRYNKHILCGLYEGLNDSNIKNVAINLSSVMAGKIKNTDADIHITAISFTPHAIYDCRVIYSQIENPIFNSEGFSYVDFSNNI